MAKGRKTGGRQKGARNIASAGIKALLAEVLPDGELKRLLEEMARASQ